MRASKSAIGPSILIAFGLAIILLYIIGTILFSKTAIGGEGVSSVECQAEALAYCNFGSAWNPACGPVPDCPSPPPITSPTTSTSTTSTTTLPPPSELPVLRGVGVLIHPSHWKNCPGGCTEEDFKADLELLKSEGLNAIRTIHYMWRYAQPDSPDAIAETGFTSEVQEGHHRLIASIDQMVEWCTELDMYLILDLQTSSYHPAPDWAQDLGCPAYGRHATWDWLMSGTDDTEEVQRGIRNVWGYIARRYADNPHVIFNIWNEPSIRDLDPEIGAPNYKAFIESCISTIRVNENVKHIIIIPEYFGLRQMGYSDNIVGDSYTYRDTHFYTPWEKPYDRDTQRDMMENDFRDSVEKLTNTGLKLIVGEFGRRHRIPDPGSIEWIEDAFDIINSYGIEDQLYFSWSRASDDAYYSLVDYDGTLLEPYYSLVMSRLGEGQ